MPRLFIVDGSRAFSRAIRNCFGHAVAIQRCQIHNDATSSSGWTRHSTNPPKTEFLPGLTKSICVRSATAKRILRPPRMYRAATSAK